ncbi:Molybdenum cofactor synthesis protein cinnamon [Wickerhamiella sorbophila]|uniref:Molybdenum cofactor synthesis protein cinnamon n=1 Tax=Wickerhamiella sorbophila TaxID=45607 RepID=A0A2T0FMP1_9ASCO|nr:Molybdenum cofactor synthesis protein cinnamon [Wickerhamiella sorbophila]PRT56254.1 Molybdenum cofactor synthesis protein cinnamon [Wickerhamiella sorbophila]
MDSVIIVVSDTCASDPSKDATGPALQNVLQTNNNIVYVADDKKAIQSAVRHNAAKYALVVTAGGTGFSPRDTTPEAVYELIDRPAPGIVTAMLVESLKITPLAALARPVAGTIGHSLVITVPGSPKGAVENIQAVLPVLTHAIKLVSGESSRDLHSSAKSSADPATAQQTVVAAISTPTKLCPHHGHGKGLKFYGSAQRPRESPFPMISFEDAYKIVMDAAAEPTLRTDVALFNAVGRVIADDIHARVDVPQFRASIVDGYAVLHSDCPGILPLAEVVTASKDTIKLKPGTCVRITTGAPVPHGATAVIPVENTTVAEEKDGKEVAIKIHASGVGAGDNIREIGSDIAKGSCVLAKGTPISSLGGEVGLLASIGIPAVRVFEQPVVGVLSTGDELVSVDSQVCGSQVRDSNRPMLLAALNAAGIDPVDLGIAPDKEADLLRSLRYALSKVNVLITTGGVSMGELDLLKPAIEELGGQIHFGRVNMKPGKPITFATIGETLVFALPGNPASASVCYSLFVQPCIDKLRGHAYEHRHFSVAISRDVKLDTRPEFQRVHIKFSPDGPRTESTGFQRSSAISSMVGANALLCLPARTDDVQELKAGSHVPAILLNSL